MHETHLVTIDRHILDEERRFPEARGAFSNILTDMALAAKVISREVNMAGLLDIIGQAGHRNIQGRMSRSWTPSPRPSSTGPWITAGTWPAWRRRRWRT
jgi:hypothetical protein